MKKNYFLCGHNVSISAPFFPADSNYFRLFETEETISDLSVLCNICDELPEPDGVLSGNNESTSVYCKNNEIFRYSHMGTDSGAMTHYSNVDSAVSETFIVERNYNVLMDSRYMWTTIALAQLMLNKNVLFFHASFIEYNGNGIIFSAPCGTGKSTQAALWEKHRNARIINGDKAGISVKDGSVFANGVPFCGTSDICNNVTVPLKAIVLLEQAETNVITRLTGFDVVQRLMRNIYLDMLAPDEQRRCIDLLISIISQVPVYLLKCTPDEQAVKVLETIL
ncbi:MAG: hypothetical protein IKW03_00250 [Clostridia bacterium]|nr:hypothetical protein [Clostridia bacterium]